MDKSKRQIYIDLLIEFCNRTPEDAEAAIDEALDRRREKKKQDNSRGI